MAPGGMDLFVGRVRKLGTACSEREGEREREMGHDAQSKEREHGQMRRSILLSRVMGVWVALARRHAASEKVGVKLQNHAQSEDREH
jgi:hypothetical protein